MIRLFFLLGAIAFSGCASQPQHRIADGTELGFEKKHAFSNGSFFIMQSIVPWQDDLVVTGLLINRTDRPLFFEPDSFSMILDGEEHLPSRTTASGLIDYHEVKKAQFFYPRKELCIEETKIGRSKIGFRAIWQRHKVTGVIYPIKEKSETK